MKLKPTTLPEPIREEYLQSVSEEITSRTPEHMVSNSMLSSNILNKSSRTSTRTRSQRHTRTRRGPAVLVVQFDLCLTLSPLIRIIKHVEIWSHSKKGFGDEYRCRCLFDSLRKLKQAGFVIICVSDVVPTENYVVVDVLFDFSMLETPCICIRNFLKK